MATTKALELAQLADSISVNANGEISNIGTLSSLDINDGLTVSGLSTISGNTTFTQGTRLFFGDNANTGFLSINASPSHATIKEEGNNGHLYIQASNLILEDTDGNNYLYGTANGSVQLYHSNDTKLETLNTGVNVTGNMIASGFIRSESGAFAAGDSGDAYWTQYTNNSVQFNREGGWSYIDQTANNATTTGIKFRIGPSYTEALTIDKDANVTIHNDLTVSGNTTFINSNNLEIEDLVIRIAAGAGTTAAANGAGIEVDGGLGATITYDNTGPYWRSSLDFIAEGNITATQVGNSATALINIDTDANAHAMLRFQEAGSDLWRIVKEPTDELVIDAGAGDIKATFYTNGDIGFNDASNAEKFLWDASASQLRLENSSNTVYNASDWDETTSALFVYNSDSTSGTGAFIHFSHVANSTGKAAIGVVQGSTGRDGELVFLTRDGGATDDPISEAVRITGPGNVGINTTTPDSRLTVNVNSDNDGIELQSSEVKIASLARTVVDSQVMASLDGVATRPIHIGGIVNEDVILGYAGGNVGIGETDPQTLLHLTQATTGPIIRLENATNGIGANVLLGGIEFFNSDSSGEGPNVASAIESYSGSSYGNDGYLTFSTYDSAESDVEGRRASEKMRITTNGNVGIGSTNPFYKLVISNSGAEGLEIAPGYAGGRNLFQHYNRATSVYVRADNYASQHNFYANTTEISEVNSDGIDLKVGSYKSAQVRHSITPTLNLDFANSKSLDPRISYSRDSVGTYYDSKGILRYANANEPRFDHDPVTGVSKGLLVEDETTNFAVATTRDLPIDFNGMYLADRNYMLAPDGTFSGARILASWGTARHEVNILYPGTANDVYMATIWVKPLGSVDHINLSRAGGSDLVRYNLTGNGSIDGEGGTATGTITKTKYDWYKLTFRFTETTTGTNRAVYMSPGIGTGVSSVYTNLNGDGENGVAIWGMQVEEPRSDYASSYVPLDTTFASRASIATYYDKDGIIRSASKNSPRYGYRFDGNRWIEAGLITEGSGTNLLVWSNNFNRAGTWANSPSQTGILSAERDTTVTAPDGSPAWKITATSTTDMHYIHETFTETSNYYYCFSVYAKASATCEHIAINLGASRLRAVFDLTDGSVVTSGYSSTYFISGFASSQYVGDGWWRVAVHGQSLNGAGNYVRIGPSDGSGDYQPTFDGTGVYLYLFGAMMDESPNYQVDMTSYIETADQTLTRAADVVTSIAGVRLEDVVEITEDNFDFFNPDEGTTYVEAYPGADAISGYAPTAFSYWDGVGSDDRLGMRLAGYWADDTLEIQGGYSIDGGNFIAFYNPTTEKIVNRGTLIKAAMSVSDNNFIATYQGDTPGTSSASIVPEVKQLTIGSSFSNSYPFNGHIKKLSYYDQQLTSDELQALTENN